MIRSDGMLNRLYPASINAASRSARSANGIDSTALILKGSMTREDIRFTPIPQRHPAIPPAGVEH